MEEFDELYQKFRSDQVVEGGTFDPAVSLVDQSCLQLDGSFSLGGSIAKAVEKSISKRELVTCHTLLPHPLFEMSSSTEQFSLEEEEKMGSDHASLSGKLTTPMLNSVLQQELEEEEEGEEQEVGVASHPVCNEGTNLLAQAAGSGAMNFGSLQLQPSLNIGRLLDPLHPPSCDLPHPFLEASGNRPTNRSMASYLSICRDHLSFSEEECVCAVVLSRRIQEAGERGVMVAELTDSCYGNSGGRSLQDHIMTLLNFEMVSLLGQSPTLVSL